MSYQFESSSPPSLSSSISSLCSSDSSPPSSFISSYFTENNDIITSHQQQQQQYHHHPTNNNNHHHHTNNNNHHHHHHHHHHQQQQQQQQHHHHHYHYQQHHLSQNVHNNFLLVTDQNQAKTKKEDYDYSILNIIPNLISEKRKKTIFVEKLVDMTCHIIEIIWADMFFDPSSKVISLKVFVKETLRRSRTSYSTLQATLLYLFRIKSKISLITDRSNRNNNNNNNNNNPATCCRRMFLAALIIASKYLQDCNYSNRAWSRVSGLPINELNTIEICFLRLIDYNLFISENNFKHWSSLLLKYIQETFYFSGTDSRKDSVDNNNYYHHHHHHHHHHPHNHPFINDILENQHSIVKLQEIMKSMDEFESLDQRSCQNDLSSGKYQNRKSTRIMAN